MIYKPAKGSVLSEKQAQKYGEGIAALIEESGGNVSPDSIVTDAKHKKSPLHDFFIWDDAIAAHKYRLEQASYLLRSIHVVIEKDEQEFDVRAFHNVIVKTADETVERTYVQIDRVMSEHELYEQIMDQAIKALNSWKEKYQHYKEFADVIRAIEALQVRG